MSSYWESPHKFMRECHDVQYEYFKKIVQKDQIMTELRRDSRLLKLRQSLDPAVLPDSEFVLPLIGLTLVEVAFFDIKLRITEP